MGQRAAAAGYSGGTAQTGTYAILPGSDTAGGLLDANPTTGLVHGSLGSDVPGRYVFQFRSGGAGLNGGPAVPEMPILLTASAVSTGEIDLAWTGSLLVGGGFALDRATDPLFSQGLTTFSLGDVGLYDDTGVTSSTTYYYRVRAVDAGGASEPSGMAWATTPNAPPVVATPAAASAAPVTGSSVALSVMGADDQGEGNLSYTWATTGSPAAPVAFTANGTNADKTVGATFSKAGDYHFQVTITDAGGLSTTSAVTVTVAQTYTGVSVTPASPRVTDKQTDQFAAAAVDQFGDPMQQQPAFAWSLAAGSPGSVDAGGLYTAPDAGVGDVTVQAAAGGLSGMPTSPSPPTSRR